MDHLTVIGDYRVSALSDELLTNTWVYVNIHVPKEHLTDSATPGVNDMDMVVCLIPEGGRARPFRLRYAAHD